MADTIQVTFVNLDEAKRALIALHAKVQEVTDDPEFININAYWSQGPAKNALHDAFQNLKACSVGFGELVNVTIAALIQAGVAFRDADGNAVRYINGTLRYPGDDEAVAVNAEGVRGDARIFSADNKTNSFVAMNAEVNYAAIAEIYIGRMNWATGIQIGGAHVEVGDSGDATSVVSGLMSSTFEGLPVSTEF
jgi:fructose-1,6-bisphosphatase